MSCFPIIQGTRTVSTRSLCSPEPIEEYDSTTPTTVLSPSEPLLGPYVLTAMSPVYHAILTVSYYPMKQKEHEDDDTIASINCWWVELRIQIIPASEGFSSSTHHHHQQQHSFRDSLFRMELPSSSCSTNNINTAHHHHVTPSALFSADERFLACLLPHPQDELQSSVIGFQLRKPALKKRALVSCLPPLPSYLKTTTTTPIIIPVATNPRLLAWPQRRPLLDVTTMTTLGTTSFVLACRNGRLLVVCGKQHFALLGQDDPFRTVSIVAMHGYARDRLAVVYQDGIVSLFQHTMDAPLMKKASATPVPTTTTTTNDNDDRRSFAFRAPPLNSNSRRHLHPPLPSFLHRTHYSITPTQESTTSSSSTCQAVCGLQDSYVALLYVGKNSSHVEVRFLPPRKSASSSSCPLVPTLVLDDPTQLQENAHITTTHTTKPHRCWFRPCRVSLTLDCWTGDCVAVRTMLSLAKLYCHVLWNWRTNTQGFTVVDSSPCLLFQFAQPHHQQQHGSRKLIRMSFNNATVVVEKELLEVALLSPPNARNAHPIRPPSLFLLSARSVSYPCSQRNSALEHFSVRWTHAMIPKAYNGTPHLAVFATAYGRSLAVASTHGVCVLDCTGGSASKQRKRQATSVLLSAGRMQPRWHLFHQETDERSFRVMAMVWWERVHLLSGGGEFIMEDVLVAVIERQRNDGDASLRYSLCCWPSRDLGKHSQLLTLTDDDTNTNSWGVPLPLSYTPGTIGIVSHHTNNDSSNSDKACVLLSVPDESSSFHVFQCQVSSSQNRTILCREASRGSIGDDKANIFLASANFDFDLEQKQVDPSYVRNVATLGAIRAFGVDALLLSSSTVSAVGQVFCPERNKCDSQVASYWLADAVQRPVGGVETKVIEFNVWAFQMANGRIGTWSVPIVASLAEVEAIDTCLPDNRNGVQLVHPKGIILGLSSWTGTTSLWMQKSSRGARTDFLAGTAPLSRHGFVVGISQTSRKALLSDNATEGKEYVYVFDSSDLVLYPPYRLAPIFGLASEGLGSQSSLLGDHLARLQDHRLVRRSTILCLQLLILRAVDVTPNPAATDGISHTDFLPTILRALKTITSPLQFMSMVLKIGRQLEQSSLERLFPLRCGTEDAPFTIDSLFSASLFQGSLSVALSAIPMLQDIAATKSKCTLVFHHCLNVMYGAEKARILDDPILPFCVEESNIVVDVFRYSMTIDEGADQNNASDQERRYSLTCGVPNVFRNRVPSRSDGLDHLLTSPQRASKGKVHNKHVQELKSWDEYSDKVFSTVVAAASRFILSLVFGTDVPTTSWAKLGSITYLLVKHDVSFHRCSHEDFKNFLENVPLLKFSALAPDFGVFFRKHTGACVEIERDEAESIFDLCLVLLANASVTDSDVAGVILVAIVAGHSCGTLDRAIDFGSPCASALWDSYLTILNDS